MSTPPQPPAQPPAQSGGPAMSPQMQALLAPTIDSRSSWRELFILPLAAMFLAMLIGALIMMATSVAPATILQSFNFA